jgi:hypothetical protein
VREPLISRKRRQPLLLSALALLVGSLTGFGWLAAAGDVLPIDDAYHYQDWADGHHDSTYTEWWYFNFFDAQQNVQAIFTYFVTDPANLTGHGLAQIAAVAHTPGDTIAAIDVYQPEMFSASDKQADVQIGASTIAVVAPNVYRITGASRDGRLAWDLVYVKSAEAWLAADRLAVGTLPWEKMSWLIYMPHAAVSGSLTADGQVYPIEAPGYHDHNWGEWIFADALWNWGQYSEPGLSFEMGDFIGKPSGVIGIEVGGQRTVFTKDQYRLFHTRWAFDATNTKRYPVASLLVAQNDTSLLRLTLRAIAARPLRGDAPFPLPDSIVYEQTAEYDGQLWQKDSRGRWELAVVFKGNGFAEYTARTWRQIGPP